MHTPQLIEVFFGLALAGAGLLLTRFLYLAYRRAVVPRALANGVLGDLVTVVDLGLLVMGGMLVLHGLLPIFAG